VVLVRRAHVRRTYYFAIAVFGVLMQCLGPKILEYPVADWQEVCCEGACSDSLSLFLMWHYADLIQSKINFI
jgi:hypothetical protein